MYSPWTGSDPRWQNAILVINNIPGQPGCSGATGEKENGDKLSGLLRVMEDKCRAALSRPEKPYYTLAHGDLRLNNILLREVFLLMLHHEMKNTLKVMYNVQTL